MALTRPAVSLFIRHLGAAVALTFALSAGQAIAAEKAAEGGGHKATSSTSFVAFDPFYSTVLDGQRARGLMMVEMGLDVPDQALRERVNLALPAIRDAYVRGLSAYATTAVRLYRQPNVEDIGNRLQAITDQMLGKKGAAKVLMVQTAVRISQ
jgi:flagellar basal body-associated protein FliL